MNLMINFYFLFCLMECLFLKVNKILKLILNPGIMYGDWFSMLSYFSVFTESLHLLFLVFFCGLLSQNHKTNIIWHRVVHTAYMILSPQSIIRMVILCIFVSIWSVAAEFLKFPFKSRLSPFCIYLYYIYLPFLSASKMCCLT